LYETLEDTDYAETAEMQVARDREAQAVICLTDSVAIRSAKVSNIEQPKNTDLIIMRASQAAWLI
jgi:hypothetical protein